MSWDLYVAAFNTEFKTIDDVPQDWKPPVIDSGAELIRKIMAIFPAAIFESDGHGRIVGNDYSISLSIEADDPAVNGFVLFVRGGESAAYAVAELVNSLGLRAFDLSASDGALFPGPDITAGWRAWREYCNRVVGERE
jgi:hypothetical protein